MPPALAAVKPGISPRRAAPAAFGRAAVLTVASGLPNPPASADKATLGSRLEKLLTLAQPCSGANRAA
jgi:hypothetical protein